MVKNNSVEFDGSDEHNIQLAILTLMKNGCIWTNAELKSKVQKLIPLSTHDKSQNPERPNEAMWENRVNNALSSSRKSSLYGQSFVENCGLGKHRITQKGLNYINEDLADIDIEKLVDEFVKKKHQ